MADDDYYPPLVHRSRYRPDETPFDPLQVVSPAPSPFEMFNPAPVNPFGGDSEDYTTAHVNAAYDREQDYNNSIFGKVKSWLYSKPDEAPEEVNNGVREQPYDLTTPGVRDAEMQGGGATVFGKGLGALGLDESGDRPPKLAERLRKYVNEHKEVSKVLQLNADQAKASLPGVFAQAAEREGKGPFRRKDDD
jgi:hypothetical protein